MRLLFTALIFCLTLAAQAQFLAGRSAAFQAATVAECATTDTAIAHDTLLEGFTSPAENTWTEAGTSGSVSVGVDTSSLTTGKPDGACDTAMRLYRAGGSSAGNWYRHALASTIDLDTQALDCTFYLYIGTGFATSGSVLTIFGVNPTTTASASSAASITLNYDGSNMRVRGRGGASSTAYQNLTANSWNRIDLHIDTSTTGNLTYIKVNGGSAIGFNRSTDGSDASYITIGAAEGAVTSDSLTAYFDLLCINTP